MYIEQLQNIGLTHNQSTIYSILLERGALSASRIKRWAAIERSLVYVVLNELISLSLVVRDDSKKVAVFQPASPSALLDLVQKKQSASEVAQSAFDSVYYQLQQAFEVQSGQPGIRFYPGAKGLQEFYTKLNNEKPDEIFLIRSTKVEENEEMNTVVQQQIEIQQKLGIRINVITPTMDSLKERIPLDNKLLIERRVIERSVFETASQIIIYNNVVAHTTYRNPIVTTVIEHEDIASTLTAMFGVIWKKTLAETQINVKKYLS
jgi:sugar-specific transcriptional regulator TrmB